MYYNCPKCFKEISNEAKSCPHCGFKIKKPRARIKKFLLFGIGLLAVLCLVLAALYHVSNDKYSSVIFLGLAAIFYLFYQYKLHR